jgi:hypothetical protein
MSIWDKIKINTKKSFPNQKQKIVNLMFHEIFSHIEVFKICLLFNSYNYFRKGRLLYNVREKSN